MSLRLVAHTGQVVDDPTIIDVWWAVSCPRGGCRNAGPWHVAGPHHDLMNHRYLCAACRTPMRVVRL